MTFHHKNSLSPRIVALSFPHPPRIQVGIDRSRSGPRPGLTHADIIIITTGIILVIIITKIII